MEREADDHRRGQEDACENTEDHERAAALREHQQREGKQQAEATEIGDVTGVGTPKAGVFAEGAARVVAGAIVARVKGGAEPGAYSGRGSCYVDFGHGKAARVDVDFSGPKPTGVFHAPTPEMAVEKTAFGRERLQRWFGT